jgi:hypothetical protein
MYNYFATNQTNLTINIKNTQRTKSAALRRKQGFQRPNFDVTAINGSKYTEFTK